MFKINKSTIKYFFVGLICQLIDYISTLGFFKLILNLFISNAIGYSLGSIASYILHAKYTFNYSSSKLLSIRQISFYLMACLAGIISGYLILNFNLLIGLKFSQAKIIQLFIIALVQYILNSRITFKKY